MPLYEMAPGFAAREDNGVVFLAGELEAETAPEAREALRAAEQRANDRVVIDVSALTFCDSSGAHVLLGAVLRANGRPVVLRIRTAWSDGCSTSPASPPDSCWSRTNPTSGRSRTAERSGALLGDEF